jgi:glycosyltransferase involved in cell wall biosynthesis
VQSVIEPNNAHVIACIPYYNCINYIRRAVESLLAQTYRNLTVVVLNDADQTTPPWPVLADIKDPRLVRFDLTVNKGPYFATQVVLAATPAAYLLIQDSDDWSHPLRVTRLLNRLQKDKADLAISAQPQFYECADGTNRVVGVRWLKSGDSHGKRFSVDDADRFMIDTKLTSQFKYRSPHHGLFRIETLRNIGGYYGGFRFSYDVLITNLILMTGRITHVAEPLYHRLIRPTSLTQSEDTGIQSIQRKLITAKTAEMYSTSYRYYLDFLKAKMTGGEMTSIIRGICRSNITQDDWKILFYESERLKKLL